ncbi:MAG: AAA family ATPase [Pirellulaceae bacterium]|nr:AAA family ATPase [Pirellulaceae bacterium]
MKIKDVQVDGFGVWSGLSVHSMPDSMTVFYGPNEAGKTTLMQFLRTMFYGFTADRRTRYLPPVFGGKPGGAIRVTGPGGGYEICRRAQLDQQGSMGAVSVTGSDGLSQGPHRLAMLMGQVDESIFTNVFAIGLRELQELSTLDDTAAADELYKLSSGLDRVSLVDVIRQLRGARQQIAGDGGEPSQLQRLMAQREKLKDEIEQLVHHGRRWAELASLRTTQSQELDELKQRIEQWALEAKSYDLSLQVRPTWLKKAEIAQRMSVLNARLELPDESADRLAELELERQEQQAKLSKVNQRRGELREQAQRLPLRRGLMELAARIEAAAEQSPWIASIQKAQQRLESQIEQTRAQLIEDAVRLGLSEEDQKGILEDKRLTSVPDLSRQAVNQLAQPASDVRMWTTRLKQAKDQCDVEKREIEKLRQELTAGLQARGQSDIHAGLSQGSELTTLLRKRIAIEEQLKKQVARRDQLDQDAVDLQVDEAFSVERALLLGVIFVAGAFMILWGMGYWVRMFNSTAPVDPNKGLLFFVMGMCALFLVYMMNITMGKGGHDQLDEVEEQLAAIRKEIQRTQLEREELDRRLPVHSGDPEMRLREMEQGIQALESLLPLKQNLEALEQRYQAARKRAAQAAESLQSARATWKRTLQHFGISESLSPKSIRLMADGYDSLLQSRRRLSSLTEELESRQFELGAITQRVDALTRQVFAVNAAGDAVIGNDEGDILQDPNPSKLRSRPSVDPRDVPGAYKASVEAGNKALEQLAKLTELLNSQQQYIIQKRQLREKDAEFAKDAAAIEKAIDKLQRRHSALLAEYGCESDEQLLQQLKFKQEYLRLQSEQTGFAERIQEMIAGMVPMETVVRLLESGSNEDLLKRREAIGQRTTQAKQRVEQLHQRQGELAQEMKSLAADGRLAEARLELACIENQLSACAAHWQTLATTTHMLDRVCEVYETERQPETLREASAFLNQLTEGKYTRIWTPLGKNQLRIDNRAGQALPLEVLSRGTREAVFIALRLSLAAAYARRGVVLPLVLDDVLVNFDSSRAESAAKVLRDFADLGHQVIMFTCHEHIMRIFYNIGVQVRVLPAQGTVGEAEIFYPGMLSGEEVLEPQPEMVELHELEHVPVVVPEAVAVEEVAADTPPDTWATSEPLEEAEQPPSIDWLWYERGPMRFESPSESKLDWGWIESQDEVDQRSTPEDLWWRPNGVSHMKIA